MDHSELVDSQQDYKGDELGNHWPESWNLLSGWFECSHRLVVLEAVEENG